jgi:alpha-D-ribose 1-methylphosphonate 5-phosphate C-P lyase
MLVRNRRVAAMPYALVRLVVFDAHSFSIEKYSKSLLLFGINISTIRLHNGSRDGGGWRSQS